MKLSLTLPFLIVCTLLLGNTLSAQRAFEHLAPQRLPDSKHDIIQKRAQAWQNRLLSAGVAAQKTSSNGQRLSDMADYDYTLAPGSQFVDSAHFKYSGSRSSSFDYLNLYYDFSAKSEAPTPFSNIQGYVNYDSLWYYTPPGSGNKDLYGSRTYTVANKISLDEYPLSYYTQYAYNGTGQLIVANELDYNTTTSTWDSSFRDFYFYDGSGRLTKDSAEQKQGNAWEPFANFYYTYDASGKPIRLSVAQVLNGVWTFVYVVDASFSPVNQRVEVLFARAYDSKLMSLSNFSLDTIGYQNGSLNYYDSYIWNDSTFIWDIYFEERRRLNAHFLPDSAWVRYWNGGLPSDTVRLLISYNAQDNPIRGLQCIGKNSSADIEARWYYESEPSGVTNVQFQSLQFYPNPVRDELFVSNLDEGEYSINNNLGQTIQSGRFMKGSPLMLKNLPTGMYVLRIQTHSGDQYVGRIMKE
jgi:hypothetical protein